MGKNHSSVVLAKILVDATYGCEAQSHKVRARNTTVAAGNGRRKCQDLHVEICNFGPTAAFFFPKTAREPENVQMKGNSGYSTHAT